LETTGRNAERVSEVFEEMGGTVEDGFPAVHSPVYRTGTGTP
jgi:thymidylate synthase (FAD)